MRLQRIWTMVIARNREFFRDRAALGWNFLFPFFIVAGFGLLFSGKGQDVYKIGLFPSEPEIGSVEDLGLPERFLKTRYLKFIGFETEKAGLTRLQHHKVDLLIKLGPPPHQYWVNSESPKGYFIEKIFRSSLLQEKPSRAVEKREISGKEIRYIDWLFPGILAMNMMFSALWGVGYVVVRYRRNGALKRLKATPLTAFEFLSAQMFSRIFLLMFTLVVVWIGCDLFLSLQVKGSYFHLFLLFFIGSLNLTALGLALASRGTSEEFTTGVLNFITWPMTFLSEVWFSLEGAPEWVRSFAQIFPLTHLLRAVRKIMNDGVGLIDVGPELAILSVMTLLFLITGASLFSWNK